MTERGPRYFVGREGRWSGGPWGVCHGAPALVPDQHQGWGHNKPFHRALNPEDNPLDRLPPSPALSLPPPPPTLPLVLLCLLLCQRPGATHYLPFPS